MQLKDKTAIVTGAASGIGKEIARQFVREGARVAIADRNLDAARTAADEIRAGEDSTLTVQMDVTSEEQVNASVEQVCRDFGGVDILVPNAGIQIVALVDQYAFADWKKMLAGLIANVPDALKGTPEYALLRPEADRNVYNIIQLIYRSRHYEGDSKDFEFSSRSMEDHWSAGRSDTIRTLRHPEVLERPTTAHGMFTFDVATHGRLS
jgi:hypothetical protein